MDGKKLVLLGILVIAACAAFVYFDPMDLDLLGLKQKSTVAKPAVPKHIAANMAHPTPVAPKSDVAPTQSTAPAALPPSVSVNAPAPKAAVVATQAGAPAAATRSMESPVEAPVAASPVAAPHVAAQAPQPTMKLSPIKLANETKKETKIAAKPAMDKPPRPKNLDLRRCLDLEDNATIAKCAGE